MRDKFVFPILNCEARIFRPSSQPRKQSSKIGHCCISGPWVSRCIINLQLTRVRNTPSLLSLTPVRVRRKTFRRCLGWISHLITVYMTNGQQQIAYAKEERRKFAWIRSVVLVQHISISVVMERAVPMSVVSMSASQVLVPYGKCFTVYDRSLADGSRARPAGPGSVMGVSASLDPNPQLTYAFLSESHRTSKRLNVGHPKFSDSSQFNVLC